MKVITRERAFSPKNIEEQRRIFLVREDDLPWLPHSVYVEITEQEQASKILFTDIVKFVEGLYIQTISDKKGDTSTMWISTAKDYFKELSLRLEDRRFTCHYFSPADIPGASEITYVMWHSNESYSLEEQKDFVKEYWRRVKMAEANTGSSVLGEKDILEERQETHGDFAWVAEMSQELKDCFRQKADWYNLTYVQREALDNIAQKTARIFSGNPNFADHWVDIQGYAKLAEKEIRKGENQDGPTSPK